MRLDRFDLVRNFLHQRIGVVSPPVIFAGETCPKTLERLVILERRPLRFVIEIVVELDTIDIVFLDNFSRDVRHPLTHGRNTRIKNIAIR
ncbi:hypothetical protein D9M69_609560 [compost metagenome]